MLGLEFRVMGVWNECVDSLDREGRVVDFKCLGMIAIDSEHDTDLY